MSIPMTKYVNITSGVGGNANVATRKLIGCVFTTNAMVDPLLPLFFQSADNVGLYFGTTSEEYLRAVKYFGYISPAIRAPQSIMFARYVKADSPAAIYGVRGSYVITALQAATAGLLSFNFGGTPTLVNAGSFVIGAEYTITSVGTTSFTGIGATANTVGVVFVATGTGTGTGTATTTGNIVQATNLSAASSLADAAAKLQTSLRTNVDAHLSTCTVSYDAVAGRFIFTASSAGVATGPFSVVQIGTGATDLASLLGWYAGNGAAVISSSVAKSALDSFTQTTIINNNFGSFCFTTASALTLSDWTAVATYNASLNVMFMFCILVTPLNYAATNAALVSIAGVGMTYQVASLNEYPEMIPMAVEAAVDFTQRNGVNNFMYRQMSGYTPSVTDPTLSNTLDAAIVNYYGQTQSAGQLVSFYQNGVLTGLSTAPQMMNIFCNEQWFKAYIAAAILSLQLSLPEISANTTGRGQLLALLQSAVNQALFNGTISVGKPLTTSQQLYITNLTGDNLAWMQVQNTGYWLDMTIQQSVDPISHLTIYTAVYTLVYSKNDAVRAVTGTHVLI